MAREVALLRSAGIHNFNIDLIAGLPGQTPGRLAGVAGLGRAAGSPARLRLHAGDGRGQPAGKWRFCKAARVTARRMCLPKNDRRVVRDRRGAVAPVGTAAIRDFELRAAGLRIAPQLEVLAAGAIRGIRRGRALLGRRDPLPERRIARRLRRLRGARRVALRGDQAARMPRRRSSSSAFG